MPSKKEKRDFILLTSLDQAADTLPWFLVLQSVLLLTSAIKDWGLCSHCWSVGTLCGKDSLLCAGLQCSPFCSSVMHWSRSQNTRRYDLRPCSIPYFLTVETPLKLRLKLGASKGKQQMGMCGFFLRSKVRCSSSVCACDANCDRCMWIIVYLDRSTCACFTSSPTMMGCDYLSAINKCTMQTCEMGKEMMSNLETRIETVKALALVFNTKYPSKPVKSIAIKVKKIRHKMTRAGWSSGTRFT